MNKRVVITGIGLVSANGHDKNSFWENLYAGNSFVEYDAHMDEIGSKSKVNCRISEFNWSELSKRFQFSNYDDEARFVKFALVAGARAFEDSLLDMTKIKNEDCGIVFASAIGGTPTFEKVYQDLLNKEKNEILYKPIGKYFYNAGMLNFPANILASKYGFENICTAISTGCTGGIDALGMAYDIIRNGDAKVIMANASEAPLADITYATLDSIGALSTAEGDYSTRSRPFDAKRAGFVIGEGAAALIIEELEHAITRKANIYGEILSYSSQNNAFHMTDLVGDGEALTNTIMTALEQAEILGEEIDYINAHGSSTKQNDSYETKAFKRAFGEHAHNIAINSTKSMLGHSLSSASMMGIIALLGSLRFDRIHPTAHLVNSDPECDLYYVPNKSIYKVVDKAMLTASGFGGIHSVGIFSKYNED